MAPVSWLRTAIPELIRQGSNNSNTATGITFQPALLFIFIGFIIAFTIHTIVRHARRRRFYSRSSSPSALEAQRSPSLSAVEPTEPAVILNEEDVALAREARGLPSDVVLARSVLRKAHRARILMDQLPKESYESYRKERDVETGEKGDEDDDTCPICLEGLDEGTGDVTHGACGHIMHHECLKFWLARDKSLSCPVCRVRIKKGEKDSDKGKEIDKPKEKEEPAADQKNNATSYMDSFASSNSSATVRIVEQVGVGSLDANRVHV